MDHVVFISHDANRTGAPIVLVHLLRWLKQQQVLDFSIVLLRGGELQSDFSALAPTYIWQEPIADQPPTIARRAWNRIKRIVKPIGNTPSPHQQFIISELYSRKPALIYANTVVASELAVRLKKEMHCAAVCHVHELRMAIEGYFGTARFGALLPHFDLVIAASEAVKANLLTTYSVESAKVVKVYEFIAKPQEPANPAATVAHIRKSLNIPDNAFIIAASGTYEWRKAPSLFIQIADYTRRHLGVMPYFVWIGGSPESETGRELQFDIEQLDLTEYVKFIGSRPNPLDYLLSAELFVLTSREDPYPLVCLEAAALAKPVLCFAQSGGMPEFVEADCGCVVPFLQTDLMAHAIQDLLLQTDKRYQLGHNAQVKVQRQHSVEVAGQQIVKLIGQLLDQRSSGAA